MQYQIDFLAVGDKQCGDAIAIRFGDLESGDKDRQTVIQIDGGYASNVADVVNHHETNFATDRIDLLVSTHPDGDHIGGMPGLIKGMNKVGKLWMHIPSDHSGDMLANKQFDYKVQTLTRKIQASMQQSDDLQATAEQWGVEIEEPFTGTRFESPWGTLTVLGPSKVYYESLLAEIVDKSAKKAAEQTAALTIAQLQSKLKPTSDSLLNALTKALGKIESYHLETLTNGGTTSASNNTSVILLLELIDGKTFLFTGDAGMPALEFAHGEFVALGHAAGSLDLVQVPHHASRKNSGPTILTKFLGDVQPSSDEPRRGVAIASVGAACDVHGHPHRIVTNAFKRRGYPVWQTKGNGVKFGFERFGWNAVDPLPMFESVETDE